MARKENEIFRSFPRGQPMTLTLATGNPHKTRELRALLGDAVELRDLSAVPGFSMPEETGATLEENAILKALALARDQPGLVLADDSGLEVDALGGAPGVFSARYAGATATDADNVARLLAALEGEEDRSARFRCVLAVAEEGHLLVTLDGLLEGAIATGRRGESGFGYDPVFVPAGETRSLAEFSATEKNRISHRAKAAEKLRAWLERSRR